VTSANRAIELTARRVLKICIIFPSFNEVSAHEAGCVREPISEDDSE
jgi:hypothetical protein